MIDPQPVYKPFNPLAIAPPEDDWLRHLSAMAREPTISLLGFTLFSMALHLGFERITYRAYNHPSGAYYWIDANHARAIASVLTRSLSSLAIELTTFAPGAAAVLQAEARSDLRVGDLCFAHKSADEATVEEAIALATLVDRWQVRSVHWWAAEFAPGAIDAFTDALYAVDNRSLQDCDLCDLTRPEPDDRLAVPALEALADRNRS